MPIPKEPSIWGPIKHLGLLWQRQAQAQGCIVLAGLLDMVRTTVREQLDEDSVRLRGGLLSQPGTMKQWSEDLCRVLLGSPGGLEHGVTTELAERNLWSKGPRQ